MRSQLMGSFITPTLSLTEIQVSGRHGDKRILVGLREGNVGVVLGRKNGKVVELFGGAAGGEGGVGEIETEGSAGGLRDDGCKGGPG